MNVLITLTSAGVDTGPFNLYSNVDTYTTAFETNISRGILVAGYTSTVVPPGTTAIRVKSTGVCSNYVDITLTIPATTTTTTTAASTSTTTTTATPGTTTTTTTAAPVITTTTTTAAPVETTTTTTTYVGPATTTTTTTEPATTTTTTTQLRYTYRVAQVLNDITCELGAYDTNWWSYTSYGDGYYILNGGGIKYFVQSISHATYTNEIISVVASSCTPTSYDYYLATEYYCPTCGVNATNVLVKAISGSALVPNRFYTSFDVSNYVYQITDTGQAPGVAIQVNTVEYLSCAAIGCGTATTTTTLPTLNAISLGYNATDAALACSAGTTTYYMYESTFLTAVTLYNDVNGTSVAADGQYSNGGVRVREQYLGTLGTSAPC